MNHLLALILAGTISAAAWVSAPTADADTVDDAFIAALDAESITYESAPYAIRAGHFVCNLLIDYSQSHVVDMVYSQSSLTSWTDAGYFVGASAAAFCPWELRGVAA